MFRSTNKDYSLVSAKKAENNTKLSILADVTKHLNDSLTDAFLKFDSKKKSNIKTKLDITGNRLTIKIEDELNGKSRFFDISNRSKGFIWYYNFIMKVMFNPKQSAVGEDTIFLLDEPGSYLHETVQTKLCKRLSEISKREGYVIYCTHSYRLLDPNIIPLNNILIVEKLKEKYILVEKITERKTASTKNSPMQPVYEALMIPEYELLDDKLIICVEGIYDKYAMDLFLKIKIPFRVFPSASAQMIINNIQYFIAYDKNFLAIWDNDKEGRKKMEISKKFFGTPMDKRFLLLPDTSTEKTRMEEMIDTRDFDLIKYKLELSVDATYETVMYSLFFSEKREQIVKSLKGETSSHFEALGRKIENALEMI